MAHTANPRYAKPAGCSGCSLQHLGFGYAPPVGPAEARLLFVGEALGWEEALAGEPFYGAAGGVLSRILMRAGIDRRFVRIANVVSCRPPQDYLIGAPWEHHAIAQCRQYLQPVLDQLPDGGVVMVLGATALHAVLGLTGVPGVTVKDFHGTVHEVKRPDGTHYWVVPSFHPSHLQRGAMNLIEIVTNDFRLALRISTDGFVRSPYQLVVDPHVDWFKQWCVGHLAKVDADVDGTHLSLDCEFLEKSPGVDESEVLQWNSQTPMTRINGGNDRVTGWTVPVVGEYLDTFRWFLQEVARRRGWAWFWNKYADLDHFQAAEIKFDGLIAVDGMWLWKHLQTDVPRGLGFVAPLASDFGAWKHWGKDKQKEGPYAAADGVQNWRTCMWVMNSAVLHGVWDVFMRDWHDRDQYCLRPAHLMGVPVNRVELDKFRVECQEKMSSTLARIKDTAAKGVLKPKLGYPKKPKGAVRCTDCDGLGRVIYEGEEVESPCELCAGLGEIYTPPVSIIGKVKAVTGDPEQDAKLRYMREGVRLVEKEITVDLRCCTTCGAEGVGPKHRCPLPSKPKSARRGTRNTDGTHATSGSADGVSATDASATRLPARRTPYLVQKSCLRRRYFWQLPFNPDAPAQILAYLDQQGIDAPVDKKTQKRTTNKKALEALKSQHRDDPFFQLQMDWKAVQKVHSTYVVRTLELLDDDDRLHPEYLPIPSTLRDSARHPNLTNVVADKSGVQGLAAGFRRCIVARDGVPKVITPAEYAAWEARWSR